MDAAAGEIVAVTDPAVTRGWEALAPGTRIVCVGAEPAGGETSFGQWITDAATGDDVPGH